MPTFCQTLQAHNAPQPQPDNYSIFIHHHLTVVVFWLGKPALTRQFAHILYCHITQRSF